LDIYIGPLVIIVAVAILSAACFNALAFRFPIAYTYTALFLLGAYVIATIVVVCIYVSGATAVVAVFGVLTLLILLWTAYQLRRYKKFMAQLVATCRDVASLQRGMFGAAALTIVLQMVWASVWVIASITLLRAWGGSEAYAVQIHSIFTFYWVSELIRNRRSRHRSPVRSARGTLHQAAACAAQSNALGVSSRRHVLVRLDCARLAHHRHPPDAASHLPHAAGVEFAQLLGSPALDRCSYSSVLHRGAAALLQSLLLGDLRPVRHLVLAIDEDRRSLCLPTTATRW
jgi:hypothetical protein